MRERMPVVLRCSYRSPPGAGIGGYVRKSEAALIRMTGFGFLAKAHIDLRLTLDCEVCRADATLLIALLRKLRITTANVRAGGIYRPDRQE